MIKSKIVNPTNKEASAPLVREQNFLHSQFMRNGGRDFVSSAEELDRFLSLTQVTDGALAVINGNIDILWHTFIEFTEMYEIFCYQKFGEFIHHRPRTSETPVPDVAVRNFVEAYKTEYGDLPEIWLNDTPAELLNYALRKTAELPSHLAWSGWPGRNNLRR